jgi:4-amino-4-deoxy-L-arabinose transferase-like glycosyltransferase
MWEGYDEWAHFAYIQHIAEHGRLPVRGDTVSREVRASLSLMPSPYGLNGFNLPLITHDEYWRLPPEEQLARKRALASLPAGFRIQADDALSLYEAQQPPLYYLIMAVPYEVFRSTSLPARIVVLRVLSMLIASLLIPVGYGTARRIFGHGRTAVVIMILPSVTPEFMIDICRIGNECLAVVLVSALILSALRLVSREAGWRAWALFGVLLGAGLLTKAYVLAFLPLFIVIALIRIARECGVRQSIAGLILGLTLATASAGWWYWRTWQVTGTVSGEQIDMAAARFTVAEKLAAARNVDWVVALDELAFSHIWVGAWSFSGVRSWMYRVFELIASAAALGFIWLCGRIVVRSWRRRSLGLFGGKVAVLASSYLLLCAGLAYHVVVDFLAKGIPATCGWYLYAVIIPEFLMVALGIFNLVGRSSFRLAAAMGSLIAAALDLYTVDFILLPYYTGIITHRASGVLNTFHISDLHYVSVWEMFQRLSTNGPAGLGPTTVAVMWMAYLCATTGLVASAFILSGASRTGQRLSPEGVKNSAGATGLVHPDTQTRLCAGSARSLLPTISRLAFLKTGSNQQILCCGLALPFSRPEHVDHKTIPARFHFVNRLFRPIVETFSGFRAKIAVRHFCAVEVWRFRFVV